MNCSERFRKICITSLCLLISLTTGIGHPFAQTAVDPLSAAAKALFNGDYGTALASYASAVADPTLKCDALYGLGTTQFRSADYSSADVTLTRSLTECPPTLASFALRGDTRAALKRNEDALVDYQQALAVKPGVIDSYLYERMASVSTDTSIGYLMKAADAARPLAGQVALHKRLITIFNATNNVRSLEQQYSALLAIAQSPEDLAEAEEALGELQISNNEAGAGYKHLQNVLNTYPGLTPAFAALLTLVTEGQDVDLLLRIRINVANQNYRPVVNKLTVYLPTATPDKTFPELYVLLGKSQRGINQISDALATFQKVRDTYPNDPMASAAALEQGITYETQKDAANAVKAYTETVARYAGSPEAPRALWKAAELERSVGQMPQAVALYDQLSKQYPTSNLVQPALSEAGTLLETSDPVRAADFFGRMGDAEGGVWQGKMLQTAKDAAGAQKAWTDAATREPGAFFSLRAQDLLSGTAPFQTSGKLTLPQDSAADSAAAESWVKTTFKLAAASVTLSATLANDPMLMRGTELWSLGWWQDATAEFDALYATYRGDAASLLQLAVYLKGIGVYRSSLTAATHLITLSGEAVKDVPPYIARLAYPLDYADLLLPAAQAEGLDPLFVATIIRTELRFDPHATSSAEDTGLMQMIPSTADTIASQLKIANFQSGQLYRPLISLQFGSHYLSTLGAALNHQWAGVVVGYNAGVDYAQKFFTGSQRRCGSLLRNDRRGLGASVPELCLRRIRRVSRIVRGLILEDVREDKLDFAPGELN